MCSEELAQNSNSLEGAGKTSQGATYLSRVLQDEKRGKKTHSGWKKLYLQDFVG